MDQDNYPTFQYRSEDISDDILECNSIPIAPLDSSFSCHLEHITTISNPKYSNVSIYTFDPVSIIPTKSSSSHNLEHVGSYEKDKTIKKEIKCLVSVKRKGKIVSCRELFALISNTSTLGAHLRMVHCLFEKGSLLLLSGTSERLASKKPVAIAQKDPMQPTLLDMFNKQPSLSSNKKNKLTSRILAWIIDDMHAFNVLENENFHNLMYEAKSRY
ncbi:3972_t:CDS:2 [Gigaspora rosea]|nr:3972_t:CDS:2 [Gigaspora rosea]